MGVEDFADFVWYIHPDLQHEGRYRQRVVESPAGPIRDDKPVGDLNRILDRALKVALDEPEEDVDLDRLRQFGSDLLHCLTCDGGPEVARLYQDAIGTLEREPLRLTLELVGPELINFPWEYLYDVARGTYLALHSKVSLVRGLIGPRKRPPEPLNPLTNPLRMLVVIASPEGPPEIKIKREQEVLLKEALDQPLSDGLVDVEWLPPFGEENKGATRNAFFDRIEQREPELHIIHFVCHGEPGDAEGKGQILLEGENKGRERVGASALAQALGQLDSLRLVILNSCLTARTNHVDEFSGVAQALIGAGVPTVIGMQHEIPVDVAQRFAKAFYATLFRGLTTGQGACAFERAFAAARRDVSTEFRLSKSCWGTPVLYARAGIGSLFPLIPRPANVSEEAQREIDTLIPKLSYLRQELKSLSDKYGAAATPDWVLEETDDLKKKIKETEDKLRSLGVNLSTNP